MSGGVSLREGAPEDLPVLFEQQQDEEANRMAVFAPVDPWDRRAFEERWRRILANASLPVRTIVAGGEVAGSILCWRDPELEAPEVTYWLGRSFWGRGVATSALAQFLEVVDQRPLLARAAATNAGSIRVLEKCGFERRRVVQGETPRGDLVDEVVLELP